MKKVVRKALLTAKAYRPGKASGGSTKKKTYTLVPDISRREIRAVSPTGSEVGYLAMEKYGDAAKNNEVFNMAVKPTWQRQGIMTALHNEAEKHFGTINPSRTLSDDGFAFWKAYRPDAVRNSYRFHADRLMGKPVSTPRGDGVISSVGDKVMIAEKDGGTTFMVPNEISGQMFKQAQTEAAQEQQQPQDEIDKADGGRTGYRAGGYADPETKNLQDWQWRPLSEVQSKLGGLSEIPSHVLSFGQFMDHTAQRAAREGLRPRDLIKAYTITRASIQRQAINSDKLRAAGFDLPPNITGKIRPEGAFGEWLHSPAGQSYLDAAEKGQQHEAAIQNAAQVMKPFGKDNDLIDALRWAAGNLPGKEGQVSHLVAAGREKASTPDEWRAFTKGIRGIGPSKSGFVASLMGRGDQPTLDARQIILHTGNPAKEASRYVARKGGEGGVEAVNRLASRQEAMNLSLPEELSPYYQHLAHHAVWDKAGNEETTHQDVMRAMQHAATGGEIEPNHVSVHPLAQIMAALGFPGLETEAHKADGGRTGYADGGSTGKLHARLVNSMNFYSRGAEAARQMSQKKGSPQQMRAMLEKAGVKPEEFAQSGFDEAFSGKPSVTSEEIFRHFHHKRPDVRATQLLSREHDDYDPDTTYETQFDEFTLHGLQNYREHLLKLPEGNNNFEESRHWPGQKNVVAHIRMGDRRTPADLAASRDAIEKMRTDPNLTRSIGEEPANWGSGAADLAVSRGTITKEEAQNLSRIKRWRNAVMEGYKPERVLHVEEIQSDWGQAGRKHGFQDQSADGPPDPNKPPQGPFVNSTPGWTNLALKHVLTEAVKGGYNKLVISPGQANADMYGLDEGRENGMKSYYDQIVPTQLNKLAKGLDPDHPGVQMFSHTLPPAWGGDEEGYKGHALEITDSMRDAVKKGLPMYKRGGMAPISNPMVGKAMALARNLTRR